MEAQTATKKRDTQMVKKDIDILKTKGEKKNSFWEEMHVFTFSTSSLVALRSFSVFSACCVAFSASAHSLA